MTDHPGPNQGFPFPFEEAAFIGGRSSVRGYHQQRFAGDASLYGSAELRLTVARSDRIVPAVWGVFGSVDAGRVCLDGDSPGGWHTSAGGRIWVAPMDRGNTMTLRVAASRERTAVDLRVGFWF